MACIDSILINEAKKEKDMDEMIDPIDSDMDMIDVLADIDDEDDEEVEVEAFYMRQIYSP